MKCEYCQKEKCSCGAEKYEDITTERIIRWWKKAFRPNVVMENVVAIGSTITIEGVRDD